MGTQLERPEAMSLSEQALLEQEFGRLLETTLRLECELEELRT
jgi:hypothetical protein